jgi:hypothetical protein
VRRISSNNLISKQINYNNADRKEEQDEEEESHNGSSTTTPGNRFGLVRYKKIYIFCPDKKMK